MLLKPAEREWLWGCRHFVYGALSVLLPSAGTLGLVLGFTAN